MFSTTRPASATRPATRPASAAAMSPQAITCSLSTFVRASGSSGRRPGSWTSSAAGSRAPATVNIAGSSSYSTRTSRAANSASSFVSAATMARGSPWYLTSPVARTGRSLNCGPKRGTGWGRSAAVMTSLTPGECSAAEVSIETIRACAQSIVTSFAWSMSGSRMSATYSCWPVTRSWPPTRRGEAPILVEVIAVPLPPPRRQRRRSGSSSRNGTDCRPVPPGSHQWSDAGWSRAARGRR